MKTKKRGKSNGIRKELSLAVAIISVLFFIILVGGASYIYVFNSSK